jgi:hypothetical protein
LLSAADLYCESTEVLGEFCFGCAASGDYFAVFDYVAYYT